MWNFRRALGILGNTTTEERGGDYPQRTLCPMSGLPPSFRLKAVEITRGLFILQGRSANSNSRCVCSLNGQLSEHKDSPQLDTHCRAVQDMTCPAHLAKGPCVPLGEGLSPLHSWLAAL